jgi:hypothetical protein
MSRLLGFALLAVATMALYFGSHSDDGGTRFVAGWFQFSATMGLVALLIDVAVEKAGRRGCVDYIKAARKELEAEQ